MEVCFSSGSVTTALIRSGSHGDVVRERKSETSLSLGWHPISASVSLQTSRETGAATAECGKYHKALAYAGVLQIRATPGALQPQSLSGVGNCEINVVVLPLTLLKITKQRFFDGLPSYEKSLLSCIAYRAGRAMLKVHSLTVHIPIMAW